MFAINLQPGGRDFVRSLLESDTPNHTPPKAKARQASLNSILPQEPIGIV